MASAHGMLQENVAIKNLDKAQDRRMCLLKGIADDLRYLTILCFPCCHAKQSSLCSVRKYYVNTCVDYITRHEEFVPL